MTRPSIFSIANPAFMVKYQKKILIIVFAYDESAIKIRQDPWTSPDILPYQINMLRILF